MDKRVSDVELHIASTDKLKKLTDLKSTDFDVALNQTINWYLKVL